MPTLVSRTLRGVCAAALAAFLPGTLSGCFSDSHIAGDIAVIIVNGTGQTVHLMVDGPSFSPVSVDVAAGGSYVEELPGVVGDIITVDATAGGLSGSGGCRAAASIVNGGTGEYGQINIASNGTSLDVICSSGWQ